MNHKQKGKQYRPWLRSTASAESNNTRRRASWWARSVRIVLRFVLRHGFRLFAIIFALLMIGRNSATPQDIVEASIHETVDGWGFNLIEWEVDSSTAKLGLLFDNPTLEMSDAESTELVFAYLERAREITEIEKQITSETVDQDVTSTPALQTKLDSLRTEQSAVRGLVESIIQQQIGSILVEENISVANRPFPPVLFGFIEPPKKMVVSPRDRIETIYAEMLDADIDSQTIEQSEQQIFEQENLSTYITNIGGLGAFPTMVIDRASLRWILSTVAHEWCHNYLSTYPLGIRYAQSTELTILNETVADIVGDEIGDKALARYYPELVPPNPTPEPAVRQTDPAPDEPETFDFRTEMRETRLAVDELLAEGRVEEAELYMELRRLDFVENGHNLRVLNQAYFAFHGNYGTSAASSSPIGPQLVAMREQSTDLVSFLERVRWFTGVQDVGVHSTME